MVVVPAALDRAWIPFPVCHQRHLSCRAERVIANVERGSMARKWLAEALLTVCIADHVHC